MVKRYLNLTMGIIKGIISNICIFVVSFSLLKKAVSFYWHLSLLTVMTGVPRLRGSSSTTESLADL